MMIGVLAGTFLPGSVGKRLFERAGQGSPTSSPEDRAASLPLGTYAAQETAVIVLILTIVTAAFWAQAFLLGAFAWLKDDYLPVVVLAYIFGACFRLSFQAFPNERVWFPEKPLTVLLLGPIMGIAIMRIVLSYAIMSVPLQNLRLLTVAMILGAFLAIGGSALVAWLAFPVFARFTHHYYASVISAVFLAVTTGWGPIGVAYLRRFTERRERSNPCRASCR